MKQYRTINDLKNDFISGDFELQDQVDVGGTIYRRYAESTNTESLVEMIRGNAKSVAVYESSDDSRDWMLLLWGAQGNTVVPYDVRNHSQFTIVEDDSDRVIADKVEVGFLNLPISGSLVAKVDTGAEMCSLHAEQVNINRGQGTVSFVAPQLSRNKLTLPLADQQAVKTSGGDTTYRAVIKTSLKVKGKILKDIEVNLNDRSEMNDPMLLGQNALQAGQFLVDPNIMKEAGELLTPEFLQALREEEVVLPITVSDEQAAQIYEALEQVGDISIADLIKVLRTQVLKKIDTISY